MFRLDNSALPATSLPTKMAPAFRLFNGSDRGMAPLLKANAFANYGNDPGFDIASIPLPEPVAGGWFLQATLPYDIENISFVGFTQVDPYWISPGKFWVSDRLISFYASSELTEVVAEVKAVDAVPLPSDDYTWEIDLSAWGDFVVSGVELLGLQFNPGGGEGEFEQTGSVLTLHGSPQFNLVVGDELVISGVQTIDLTNVGGFVSFNLPGVDYVAALDWMGRSYSPANNASLLQIGELIWNSNNYACVIATRNGLLISVAENTSYTPLISAITYDRPTGD